MTNPSEIYPNHEDERETHESEQIALAETVLASLRMGEILQTDLDILPTSHQYQLAVAADYIRVPDLSLPNSFFNLVDQDTLNLIVITYSFGSPQDRPYLEVRLENKQSTIATISKPGIDSSEPYSGILSLNDKDYSTTVPSDEIADLLDQIVVPSVDGIPISDPQNPSQARNIIDILVQSQQADIIESKFFELTTPKTDNDEETQYKIRLHSINGTLHEIEIETVLEDEMTFDVNAGTPIQRYRSMLVTLSFDNFSQSVTFCMLEEGKEPRDLPNDSKLLAFLDKDIKQILKLVDQETDVIIGLDESF